MEERRGTISHFLTRSFRYPPRALIADYARGAAGLACTLGPIALVQPTGAVIWVLGAGAAFFLLYLARTAFSSVSSIDLEETGIRASGPLGAVIRWEDLRLVRLKYFTTRSDRAAGWMQLDLRGARQRIGVDSRLEGFAELARAVAGEARRRGLELDEATRANLGALDGAHAD